MNPTDVAFSSALDQARLIRSGEISPLELTQVYLDRIAQHNDRLGAYITVAAERAISTAKEQTEQWHQGDRATLPPFFGVPMPIKDLAPVAGLPCMRGLAALRDRVAEYTPAHIQAIEGAGFNLLGKTSTSELGSMPFTEPMGLPTARNPWNLDYTPGGSSGGAAAAVAAGLAPLAHGSDGGGSVRGPAGCCGLVGFKPSRGRISQAPEGEHLMGLATPGPLARTVRDAAALLDVMSGYVAGDPYWLPNPEISFLEQLDHELPPLKIAVAAEIPNWPIHPDCQAGVQHTAKHLEQLGHHLGVGCPDFSGLEAPF
ncbi:amidase, partial [Geitlerinema sp. P-1104]|uniref:amidase n=1 Tax=Geitlerinema sp. P-1104 TaxID=2546230 RepID=UPI001476C8F5